MAHEVDDDATGKRTLDMKNGLPVDVDRCDNDTCNRPTSHPSGECSQCRED